MRLALILLVTSLAACGQAGDLYLPDKNPPKPAPPAPTSAPATAPASTPDSTTNKKDKP